jgi:hypothetical protein
MDFSVTIDIWFLVTLCLISLLLGGLLFSKRSGDNHPRYPRY